MKDSNFSIVISLLLILSSFSFCYVTLAAPGPSMTLSKPVLSGADKRQVGRFDTLSKPEADFWNEVTAVLKVSMLTKTESPTESWTLRLLVFQSFRDLWEVTITGSANNSRVRVRKWLRYKPFKTEHGYGFQSSTSERQLSPSEAKHFHDELTRLGIWNAHAETEPVENIDDGDAFLFELCDTEHGAKVLTRSNNNEFSELIAELKTLMNDQDQQ